MNQTDIYLTSKIEYKRSIRKLLEKKEKSPTIIGIFLCGSLLQLITIIFSLSNFFLFTSLFFIFVSFILFSLNTFSILEEENTTKEIFDIKNSIIKIKEILIFCKSKKIKRLAIYLENDNQIGSQIVNDPRITGLDFIAKINVQTCPDNTIIIEVDYK
jgi:hypothetical protein